MHVFHLSFNRVLFVIFPCAMPAVCCLHVGRSCFHFRFDPLLLVVFPCPVSAVHRLHVCRGNLFGPPVVLLQPQLSLTMASLY